MDKKRQDQVRGLFRRYVDRKERGIVKATAAKVGVSRQHISAWKNDASGRLELGGVYLERLLAVMAADGYVLDDVDRSEHGDRDPWNRIELGNVNDPLFLIAQAMLHVVRCTMSNSLSRESKIRLLQQELNRINTEFLPLLTEHPVLQKRTAHNDVSSLQVRRK